MIVEYITLGVYFAFLIVIGVIFAKFNKNLSDFVRGGARVTWWMAGTSITMASISAFTFTGNGSAAYEAGPTFLIIYAANIISYVMGGLFLARWYRQTRGFTVPDIIRARFGTVVEQFGIYFTLPLAPIGASIVLYSLAVFVSSAFGFPMEITIIVIGGIVVCYSVSGGTWAVMATDVVQGVVLYVVTIVVAVLALVEIGGISEFFSYWSRPEFVDSFKFVKEPGQYYQDKFSWHWIIVIFFMQISSQVSLASTGRYLAVKDGKEASKTAWMGVVLMTIGTLVWFIPPMVARFLYSAEVEATGLDDPATGAYAIIARDLLPAGMMGVMIAAMFSATMSSLDGGISGFSAVVVRNLVGRYREWKQLPELADKTHVRLCRMISLGIGICIILAALKLSTLRQFVLFDAFLFIGSVIGLPMGMPLLAGLILRKLPSWGYFAILGGGLVASVYTVVDEKFLGGEWSIQGRVTLVLIGSVVGTLISLAALRTRSENQRKRERAFFTQMFTPVDFEKEIGGANDASQAVLIGRILLALGGLLMLLTIIPNTLSDRLIIVGMAAALGLIGWILILAARRSGIEALKRMEAAQSEDGPDDEARS